MPAPHPIAKAATGRGRPGGRTAFQLAKRQQTRSMILAAAAEVFSATPYVHATIDDIIRCAGISRATFYMHFESKLALALAIYDGIAEDWLSLFDRLSGIAAGDTPALGAWFRDLAALYVDHGYITPLVGQLEIFEHRFRERLRTDSGTLIDRLGAAGLPSFATACGTSAEAFRQRVRARLLLDRLDQVCGELSLPELLTPAEADAYITIVVGELQAFLLEET